MRERKRERLGCSNVVSHSTAFISILLCVLISFFFFFGVEILMLDDAICIPVIICAASVMLCSLCCRHVCSHSSCICTFPLSLSATLYFYLSMHYNIFINILQYFFCNIKQGGLSAHQFELVMC